MGIESEVQAPQAPDRANSDQFPAYLIMGYLGDDDGRAGCRNSSEPGETTHDLRLTGGTDDEAERSAIEQDQPRHD